MFDEKSMKSRVKTVADSPRLITRNTATGRTLNCVRGANEVLPC